MTNSINKLLDIYSKQAISALTTHMKPTLQCLRTLVIGTNINTTVTRDHFTKV